MAKGSKKKHKGVAALKVKITLVALLPMFIMAVILAIVTDRNMSETLRDEMLNSVYATATGVGAMYHVVNDGEYTVNNDGDLMKGDFNITQNTDAIDTAVEGTNMVATVFYGDVRMATTLVDAKTGDRIVGTKADEDIYKAVVGEGKDVERYNLKINGERYYACYIPMKDANGKNIGMFFSGTPTKEVDQMIRRKVGVILGVEAILLVIAFFAILLMTNGIQRGIHVAENAVEGLSNGDLTLKLESKALQRNDELGDMVKGVAILLQQLIDVVRNIRESAETLLASGTELSDMASQTSSTADDISKAVEDISQGAVAQADEIDTASSEIEAMGTLIEKIVDNVAQLNSGAQEMKNSSDKSIDIINDLSTSNDRSMEAVQRISEQVNATNESAVKISSAVELITSIAEETNLLSLNASIEAARAGEQGKGFAVVAGQIQKLAEQSNESANTIGEIIRDLLEDSKNTVRVMEEVQSIMNEQQHKLDETKRQVVVVGDGINATSQAADVIQKQTESCDQARGKVVDVISNLSAISEENAASTEETTASMQELNATINLLAESAGKLQELSQNLEENISFFKIGTKLS